MPSAFSIPVIDRDKYEGFRRETGSDLADTYDRWLEFLRTRRAEAISRGATLVEVEIDLREFLSFCGSVGRLPNLQSLLDFAAERSSPGSARRHD